MPAEHAPVVILGAGVNGIAIARELLLSDQPVVLIDQADIACGATAYSSRLIHGGLRYLEYGELKLVRESLAERTRLLQLAPQFVKPLRLFIPVHGRLSGTVTAIKRILGLSAPTNRPRGAWLVRIGLWMYDRYARDPTLPKRQTFRIGDATAPAVDPDRFTAICSYYDSQLRLPERFCQAMLADCVRLSAERGVPLEVHTYHQSRLEGEELVATQSTARFPGDVRPETGTPSESRWRPSAVINATGAWVDETLSALPVASQKLMGGTKGSHLITNKPALRDLLNENAIYAEAEDGRPFFILTFGQAILIGTTDIPYEGDPYDAVATEDEIEYLIDSVNQVFPQVHLDRADVQMHYCGVRPLPAAKADAPGSVSRDHSIHWHDDARLPLCSIVGGKLTTCRSLAEETARLVLEKLNQPVKTNTRERPIPGASERDEAMPESLDEAQWNALFELFGWRAQEVLRDTAREFPRTDGQAAWQNLAGTHLPLVAARWMIQHEWVATLDDLVERRLMLLYHHPLSRQVLVQLANLLVEADKLPADQLESAVQVTTDRLRRHFGIELTES